MAGGANPDEGEGDANLQAKLKTKQAKLTPKQAKLKMKLKPKLKSKLLERLNAADKGSEHGGARDAAVAPIAEVVDSQEIPRQTDKGKATAAPVVDSVKIPYEKGELVSCSTVRGDGHRDAVIVDWRESDQPGMIKYYVHYTGYDKRLDEWVPWTRVEKLTPKLSVEDFTSPLKSPSGTPISPAEIGSGTADTTGTPTRRMSRRLRRQFDETNIIPESTEDLPALDELSEKEHEKKTKVKIIRVVWLGKYEIATWYHSPYPEEYHQDRLYICEFCLKYMKKKTSIDNHKCAPKLPPGDEIYKTTAPIDGQVGESEGTDLESTPPTSGTRSNSSGNVQHLSMYEVDGSKNKLYCQNLCLLSGLFLDHKELHYEVDSFLFYVLTENDAFGNHLVGYFSKEKDSDENLNVACILTLPPFQRKGYGKFLIALAYALSKKEGKVGTPERPLSDLGKASFTSYWKRVLLETIRDHRDASIEDLTKWTSIRSDDIISTLKPLNLVKFWKHGYVPNFDKRIIDKLLKNLKSQPDWLKIDMDKLNWPFVAPDVPHTPKKRRTGR